MKTKLNILFLATIVSFFVSSCAQTCDDINALNDGEVGNCEYDVQDPVIVSFNLSDMTLAIGATLTLQLDGTDNEDLYSLRILAYNDDCTSCSAEIVYEEFNIFLRTYSTSQTWVIPSGGNLNLASGNQVTIEATLTDDSDNTMTLVGFLDIL
ncbi:MAG: hypothetical protein IIA45_02470 [Bacteroidetes bacterium]|nr:hypothetical protein [Bacteroidota bacterium]